MATKKHLYAPGDLFCVPLPSGGYGIGLVARAGETAITLGYFFRRRFEACPGPDRVGGLSHSDVLLVSLFSSLGIIRGDWKVIGQMPGWDPSDWPMPSFGWKLSLGDEVYVRRDYAEDPAHRLREVRVSREEFDLLPKDGIPGFLALAIGLETALEKTPDLD